MYKVRRHGFFCNGDEEKGIKTAGIYKWEELEYGIVFTEGDTAYDTIQDTDFIEYVTNQTHNL